MGIVREPQQEVAGRHGRGRVIGHAGCRRLPLSSMPVDVFPPALLLLLLRRRLVHLDLLLGALVLVSHATIMQASAFSDGASLHACATTLHAARCASSCSACEVSSAQPAESSISHRWQVGGENRVPARDGPETLSVSSSRKNL